ncbi:acetone carboxylase [Nocardioides jishulii]|uniref:acetone carboxylase n=1 Tax=Nocardioides jishulii TaxID=2575440 RepID=UPI001484CAE5|nr:acetone carboxylase [Nocardioides jishulii]
MSTDDSAPEGTVPRPSATDDICSAKGCSATAAHALAWNNPKVHTPERRKVWLACDDHRESLGDFLRARNFLKDVTPHP